MKAITTEFLFIILTFLVFLAVSFALIYTYLYKPPEQKIFGLPEGAWYSIEGIDSKSFVPPPAIWFGNSLTLNGKTIDYFKIYIQERGDSLKLIFPKSVYISDTSENLEELIYSLMDPYKLNPGTYTFKFKTSKLPNPNVAFYPLITDNFGSLVEQSDNPAKFDASLGIYYLAHPEKLNSTNFVLNFEIDLDRIKNYYEKKNFYFNCSPSSVRFDFYGKLKTLQEYESEGICNSNENKYKCSFNFSVFNGKCCPNYFELDNLAVEFKLTKKGVEIWRREKLEKIKFAIVYYADKISNLDFIFENFDKLTELLRGAGCEIKHINIYPCRAKIKIEKKGKLIEIRDPDGSYIDWEACSSGYEQLNKKDTSKKSTWYCKKNGNYMYLYNPYGYCQVTYNSIEDKVELPEVPRIVYLQSVMPSGKINKELEVEFALDTPFGIENQAASVLASYTIYNFYNVFAGTLNSAILFDDFAVDGRTIKFNFAD